LIWILITSLNIEVVGLLHHSPWGTSESQMP